LARGTGSTKKHAEQDAARRALERLKAAEEAGLEEGQPDGLQGTGEEQAEE
jgi:hypothetical protein